MQFWIDIGLVFLLTLLSGVFVASEFALMSLRDSQIDLLEEKSKRGRKVAKVARNPDIFLSATQIGVTFVGFFSASFGAERLKPYITPMLQDIGASEPVAETISLVALIICISYLSLVFGELLPKKLALQNAERISLLTGPILDGFAVVMKPLIWFLKVSANAVYRIFGGNPARKADEISEEELQKVVESNNSMENDQKEILSDVIEASERSISEVMKPRADVEFLDGSLSLEEAATKVSDLQYSRFPVIGEDFDDVVGFVHVRDILDPAGYPKDAKTVRDVVRSIIKFPGTNHLFTSLKEMRSRGIHIAVVVDEYGGTDGICTLEDIIEEMIGDIHDEYDVRENPEVRSFKDGTYSIDGEISLSDFADETGLELDEGPYETVAGFIFSRLGRTANVGDTVEFVKGATGVGTETLDDDNPAEHWTLSVTRLEGMRIARVKVRQNE
jgi:putative hemolysin